MDPFRAIQIEAMGCVCLEEKQDREYHLRRMFRYYSEKFHTPLHVVETLPLDEVLRNYFEAYFDSLEDQELREQLDKLLETDEERNVRLASQAANDESDLEFVKKLTERNKSGAKPPQPKPGVISQKAELPEATLEAPKASALPPIEVKFLDAAAFEAELEKDLMSGG